MSAIIRIGIQNDLPRVLELVKELAAKYNYDVANLSSFTPIAKQTETMQPIEKPKETITTTHQEWVDPRTFFQKYSIPNIVREIKYRMTKK